jgi:hypothetical protein
MQMISSIAGLVSFVVGLVVLIKLFQTEGVMKGILGFICMLYTYIWGWQHAKSQNLGTMMWIWTGVIVLSIIISVVFGGSMAGGGGGGGEVPTPEGVVRLFFLG